MSMSAFQVDKAWLRFDSPEPSEIVQALRDFAALLSMMPNPQELGEYESLASAWATWEACDFKPQAQLGIALALQHLRSRNLYDGRILCIEGKVLSFCKEARSNENIASVLKQLRDDPDFGALVQEAEWAVNWAAGLDVRIAVELTSKRQDVPTPSDRSRRIAPPSPSTRDYIWAAGVYASPSRCEVIDDRGQIGVTVTSLNPRGYSDVGVDF